MSNMNNSNGNTNSTTATKTNSDDFINQLQQAVNDTEGFLNNLTAKWTEENPQLAKQWQEILKNNESNNGTQS